MWSTGHAHPERRIWPPGNVVCIANGSNLPKRDVQITFENGGLQISGERKTMHEDTHNQAHRVERWYGRFYRSFNIGQNILADKINATFKDGVLYVNVPRKVHQPTMRLRLFRPFVHL
jgi:HSP20 family molecular chaperone IbpA